ncbi:MAG TPA: hypothetical protein VMZ06_14310 [Candidatus Bathyarchaeia archaeon]|nr:hypothetical protein [Candidatus Bathyarchaeia archaeon]
MKLLTLVGAAAAGLAVVFMLAPASAGEPGGRIQPLRAARTVAAHRTRRIIMNNDGNDARTTNQAHTVENFLLNRTSPLAGSQVDAIFYCTGVFNLYTHRSDETELRGHGDKNSIDWAWELTKTDTDSVEAVIGFCHASGIEAFWSMRMNDTHDSADDALLCKWKQDHPDYLMGHKGQKSPHGGGRWSAVNYELEPVRDKVFRILEDVCMRYHVDGIELDFFRHPVYFPQQMTGQPVPQSSCDLMTGLIRRVREMTEQVGLKRGRPVLVAVRVPDSVGFAKAIGLDLAAWLDEGLIDILTGGGYFHLEPWENLVALGRKHGVPAYACLSGSRVVSAATPEETNADNASRWHAEAKLAWDAGVDGIYTFNLFNPKSDLFRQLGSPATLMKLEGPLKPITGDPNAMERWLKGGRGFLRLPQ